MTTNLKEGLIVYFSLILATLWLVLSALAGVDLLWRVVIYIVIVATIDFVIRERIKKWFKLGKYREIKK